MWKNGCRVIVSISKGIVERIILDTRLSVYVYVYVFTFASVCVCMFCRATGGDNRRSRHTRGHGISHQPHLCHQPQPRASRLHLLVPQQQGNHHHHHHHHHYLSKFKHTFSHTLTHPLIISSLSLIMQMEMQTLILSHSGFLCLERSLKLEFIPLNGVKCYDNLQLPRDGRAGCHFVGSSRVYPFFST